MMKQHYIYLTTNLINNHQYIGKRQKSSFDFKYLGSGKLLTLAIKKYGKENFKCEILKECNTIAELNEQEKYYIKLYDAVNNKNFYNIAIGGQGCGIPGKVLSKETRDKIGKANTGKIRTQQFKDNLSIITKSRNLSWTYRDKISASLRGHVVTEEARKKISEAHKGKTPWNKGKQMSDEQKKKISETKRRNNQLNKLNI